ncbi:uncharacterized protein LOC108733691 [Agrilus planipennis]|uniref:Uncharacterized protein LOC108733691 n=1 Tax=Agrilus planipennis TaxID=224129 RepID=A0A1W4WK19_AGRPL|nr:uncharacterized protein LOC108733691 [Agrilus planipennis]
MLLLYATEPTGNSLRDGSGTNGKLCRSTVEGQRYRRLRVGVTTAIDNNDDEHHDVDVQVDGRTQEAKFRISAGGVGRNICEALEKLGTIPTFISAVGDDDRGDFLLSSIGKKSRLYVPKLKNQRTSQFIVVLDNNGECKLLLGDGDIHKLITPKMVLDAEKIIKESPLIVFDGNLSRETVSTLLHLAEKHNIPVLFEPTDVPTAIVPFQTPFWRNIDIITPNLNELKEIAKCLGLIKHYSSCKINEINACANLALAVANKINTVILTLSNNGLIIARKEDSTEPLLNLSSNKTKLPRARHYPALSVQDLVNVSGAGDCLASGIIIGIIKGYSEVDCIANGLYAAVDSLRSESAIPNNFSKILDQKHPIKYTSIN